MPLSLTIGWPSDCTRVLECSRAAESAEGFWMHICDSTRGGCRRRQKPGRRHSAEMQKSSAVRKVAKQNAVAGNKQ